jgi:hypothetical protein
MMRLLAALLFCAAQPAHAQLPSPDPDDGAIKLPPGFRARGSYEVFAEGFAGKDEIANPNDARFRPNGLGVGPDGSLYASDSQKGRVWRIFYVGEKK